MGCSASSSVNEVAFPELALLGDPTRYHAVYVRGDRQSRLAKLLRRCFQFVTFNVEELVADAQKAQSAKSSDAPEENITSAVPTSPADANAQANSPAQSADEEMQTRIKALIDAVSQAPPGSKVLIEGFPRSVEEFTAWERSEFCSKKVASLLVLTPPEFIESNPTDQALTKLLIKRRLNRFIPETTNPYQAISFGHKALISSFLPIVSPSTPSLMSANDTGKVPSSFASKAQIPVTSVVCIVGGPGSSKKQQRELLAKGAGYSSISMGALLVAAGETDPQIKQAITRGVNVPSHEAVCEILQEAIQDLAAAGQSRIIVEGFPRTQAQLDHWLEISVGNVVCDGIVCLQATSDVLRSRLIARRGSAVDAESKMELTDSESQQMYAFEGEFATMIDYIDQEKLVPLVRVDDMGGHMTTYSLLRRGLTGIGLAPPTSPHAEEVTYAMIKPDAVQAGFEDEIVADIVRAGFKVLRREIMTFTREMAEAFYQEHRTKGFYPGLVEFMTSGPIVALALSKRSAISEWRRLAGPTDPRRARVLSPGSLRALYGSNGTRNALHGSDSVLSANRELQLVFGSSFPDAKLNKVPRGYRIVLAGGPASGKGTQAEMLREKLGVVHISTGELLRDEKKRGTELGLKAAQYFENGQLVPDEVMIPLVLERVSREDCQTKGWMLDGFPRTGAQADALAKAGLKADVFILLEVQDRTLIERVTGRRSDKNTGKIYHLKFNPPPPEVKPEDLEQRADDTEEKIQYRIQMFKANVDAIRGAFAHVTAVIDGNRDKNAIFDDVMERIPSIL